MKIRKQIGNKRAALLDVLLGSACTVIVFIGLIGLGCYVVGQASNLFSGVACRVQFSPQPPPRNYYHHSLAKIAA